MKKILIFLHLFVALCGKEALSQTTYPSRPIKIVIGFGPGTAIDTIGRMFAQHLSAAVQQPVIVENKPGANSAIAAELVAKSTPDGYTLLLTTNTSHAANPSLMKKISYNPIKDFEPIGRLSSISFVLAVGAASPYKTVEELLAAAKRKPDALSYASSNSGSLVSGAMLSNTANAEMRQVSYASSPQALTDVIAGHVDFLFVDPLAGIPHVTSGRLRALGVTSEKSIPQLPTAPSIVRNLGGAPIVAWHAIFAPKGTPQAAVNILYGNLQRFMSDPVTEQKFSALGAQPWLANPDELGKFVVSEMQHWKTMVERAGLTKE